MAWTLVAKTAFASATNPGTSSAINTTGANLIVVVYSGPGTASIADSSSNTYTNAVTLTPNQNGSIWFKASPTTSGSHTFTLSNSNFSAAILAYSGCDTGHVGGVLDQTSSAAIATGNTNEQPGSITTTAVNGLLVFGNSLDSPQGNTFSVNSGFSIQSSVDVVSGTTFGVVASTLVSPITTINPTMTRSQAIAGGSSDVAVIASFFGTPLPPPANPGVPRLVMM